MAHPFPPPRAARWPIPPVLVALAVLFPFTAGAAGLLLWSHLR